MTSQVSLQKKTKNKKNYNAFTRNFLNNLNSDWLMPGLVLAMLGIFYPMVSFVAMRSILKSHISDTAYKLSDHFTYILSQQTFISEFAKMIPWLLLLAGLYLGISKFKFMNKKNQVNVFFSLGITRTKLFMSTFLAGIVQIVSAVLIPMLLVYIFNIAFIGGSKELFLSVLFLTLTFIVITIVGYSISCFLATNVGSNSEIVFYSLLMAVIPVVFILSVQKLSEVFLLGNEYNLTESFGRIVGDHVSLSDKLSFLVPAKSTLGNIKNFVILDNNCKYAVIDMYSQDSGQLVKWANPSYTRIIGWLLTSVGITAGSVFFMNKRPAENAGFFGANKIVNAIMSFIISFCVGILSVIVFDSFIKSIATSMLLALLAFIITYLIVNLILARKLKPFVKTIKFLPIHIVVVIAFVSIFATGFFGYSKRVPKVENIKSVDMIIPSGRTIGLYQSSGASCDASVGQGYYKATVKNFTDKKDLELITSLHEELIKDGRCFMPKKVNLDKMSSDDFEQNRNVYGNIYISYKLKNGKKVTRYFDAVKSETLKHFLEIEKTKRYEDVLKNGFFNANNSKDTFKNNPLSIIFANTDYNVYVLSKNLDVKENANLSVSQKKKLVKCMYEDIKNASAYEINMPKSETLGAISFYANDSDLVRVNYNNSQENMTESENTQEMIEEPSQDVEELKFNTSSLESISHSDPNNYKFIVTSDMKNTLKFLEDNALLKYLDNSTKIVSAQILDTRLYYDCSYFNMIYNDTTNMMFTGGRTEFISGAGNDDGTYLSDQFTLSYNTNNKDVIAGLYKDSYYSYFAPNNNYFVRYKLDNGDYLVMMIPDNKIPGNIKSSLNHKKIRFSVHYSR